MSLFLQMAAQATDYQLYSTLLYSTLLYSTLLYSRLLHFSIGEAGCRRSANWGAHGPPVPNRSNCRRQVLIRSGSLILRDRQQGGGV